MFALSGLEPEIKNSFSYRGAAQFIDLGCKFIRRLAI